MMTRRSRIALSTSILAALVIWVALSAFPAIGLVRTQGTRAVHEDELADRLRRELAFVSGQAELAGEPLLALAVDPAAGTATILLSGVPLRTVYSAQTRVSYALANIPPDSIVMARLIRRTGLIPPEPIRRVDAPADTAEANQAPTTVPVETTPAATNLFLDNGIVIRMTPNDRVGMDRWAVVRYRLMERIADNLRSAWDAIRMSSPRIRGEVRLSVADADAKALYRALTDGSSVIIRSVSR